MSCQKHNLWLSRKTSVVSRQSGQAPQITQADEVIVNLGKWVLRYLFAGLVDEEIRRDEEVRLEIEAKNRRSHERNPTKPSMSIQMPHVTFNQDQSNGSTTTPRPGRGKVPFLFTPGLSIGLATPGGALTSPANSQSGLLSPGLDGRRTPGGKPQTPAERNGDYFSARPATATAETPAAGKVPMTPAETEDDGAVLSPSENGAAKANAASLSKRLRISFTGKKLGRTQAAEPLKPPPVEEAIEDSESRSDKADEKSYDGSFLGTLQRIRTEYEEQTELSNEPLLSLITPSPAQETPVLRPPPATTIIIQEDRPDVAGVADLYEGSLGKLGQQADLIEKVAPFWLGEVLLRVSGYVLITYTSTPC